ncbi:MAG: YdcF family protein [Myxococcota bacterium]
MIDWLLFLGALTAAGWLTGCLAAGSPWRRAGLSLGAILILGVGLRHDDLAMQKLVSWASMPVGILWFVLLALAIAAWSRGQRSLGLAGFLAFFAYTLLGNVWFSSALATALEDGIPSSSAALHGEPYDAVLVVGGGAVWKNGEAELTDYGDRVLLGARLFRAHKAQVLITTGSTIGGLGDYQDLTTATSTIWTSLGVEERAILRIPEPKNTSQEIAALAAQQQAHGWRRIAVVSSAWHLPRIAALARKQGISVDLIGADRRGGNLPFHPAYAVPTGSSFRTSQLMAWETLGRAVGR